MLAQFRLRRQRTASFFQGKHTAPSLYTHTHTHTHTQKERERERDRER